MLSSPLHVLLVDDNPNDRALAQRGLRQEFGADIGVREVRDQAQLDEALAACDFDLVVTDYQLGWSDGIQVLEAVKARRADCPVVMFTNSGSEEVAVEAMKRGLDDYVIKSPQRLVRLAISCRHALERADALREAALLNARLRESEEQFRVLVEGVSEYALFVTDPSGNIVSWNPGLRRVLGYEESEIVGRSFAVLFPPEAREKNAHEQEMRKAAARGQASDDGWHVKKDGTPIYVHGVLTALRDEAGNLRGFAKVMRDATQMHLEQERLQKDYQKEHRIAEALQRSLLMSPPPDAFPGLTVKALYESAYDDALIGGDFFDVYALGEDKVAVAVGDVTGKGLDAATYTAEIKFALRAFLHAEPWPAQALARLNDFVARREPRADEAHSGSSYVALALAVVDTGTGRVACACAGMDPPFLLRAATGEAVPLSDGGALVGMEPGTAYDERTEVLGPGDLLAMTSDGITEARSGPGARDFFGYERLVGAVREALTAGAPLPAVAETVAGRAKAFAGGRSQDDICLVLVQRTPTPPRIP